MEATPSKAVGGREAQEGVVPGPLVPLIRPDDVGKDLARLEPYVVTVGVLGGPIRAAK